MKYDKESNIINVRIVVLLIFILIIGVLGTHIIITITTTQQIIIEQKQDLLRLLSKNIIENITTSFIIPSMQSFGRISLAIPEQYNILTSILETSTQEFSVTDYSIFSANGRLIYTSALQNIPPVLSNLEQSIQHVESTFTIDFPSLWEIIFGNHPKAMLYSYYPIVIDERVFSLTSNTLFQRKELWGILELVMDCTEDMYHLQRTYRNFSITTLTLVICAFLGITIIIYKTNNLAKAKVHALEQIKQELAQKERLASIGNVVASLAHEIRNPLGILYSSIQMCLKYKDTIPERLLRIIETMKEEITNLRTLVNTFLDYAKPSVIDNSPIHLRPIIETVCSVLQEKKEAHQINIINTIAVSTVLSFSKDILYRALLNIVENALDAPDVSDITIYSRQDDTHYFICVHDNGLGFLHSQEVYTEPFYTTKEHGVGLGLAIVKKNMEYYGGNIVMSNHEKGGGLVSLLIPISRVIEL